MTAPVNPTSDEVRSGRFYWEYETVEVDVSTMADPPGSVLPLVRIQRRMVSTWEIYAPPRLD